MIDNKKWIKFDLISEINYTEQFEIGFCKEFFAINQGIDLDKVKIIDGARGIENEPINGAAFQSKYIKKGWDWSQIESSLKKILKYHSKYYPDLEKVFIYVKRIGSDKYLEERNKQNGILQKLQKIGVEVEVYSEWEKIWTNNKYSKLKEYFEIKQDVEHELQLVEKYIDSLYLNSAKDLLSILEQKIDILEPKHKYKYFIQLGRQEQYNNLYKEENKANNTSFCQHFINAAQYSDNWKASLNKSIGLYGKGDKEEAKKIMEKLYNKDTYNDKIYGFYLITHIDDYTSFEMLLDSFDVKYKDSIYIKGILGNLYIEKGGSNVVAFEQYYKEDCNDINDLTSKITYFQRWRNYLNEKYGFTNLSTKIKNEYLELEQFLNIFEKELEGKDLFVEIDILNTKAIINTKINKNHDKALYYFNKALEKKDSGIIKMNRVLSLLNKKGEYDSNIIDSLEEIVINFDKYLKETENDPNGDVLYQVHVLLAEEYFSESKRLKKEGLNKQSDIIKEQGFKILQDFKEKYYNKVENFHKRNFGIWDVQLDEGKAGTKILEYLKEDNCIIYNLLAFRYLGVNKYIEEAYNLYKEGHKDSFESIVQLANTLLLDLKDEKRFFEIFDGELNDLSNEYNFKNYIITGINLKEVKKVENKLGEYKKINGEDYIYIKFKAYLEEQRQNIKGAINIINNFQNKDEHIDLLFWKAKFEYDSGDNEYKNTLKSIFHIGEMNDFTNFSIEDKLNFISSYGLIDIEGSIKLCYRFLQEKNIIKKHLIDLKKIYFGLFLKLEGNSFGTTNITEDTLIKVKNIKNNDVITLLLDGYSNDKYINYIFDKQDIEYKNIIGKSRGDIVKNLFNGEPFLGIDNEYEIISIQNKYIYMHQFNMNKSEELGIIKIHLPENEGEMDFTNFFDLLNQTGIQEKDRKLYIDENFTKKGLLTFGVLKHFYGRSYIDHYYQKDFELLKSDQLFKTDNGERIINIILDPSSIISIFEFGLEDILINNFNLFITQSTFSYFNNELTDIGTEPKSKMSVHSDGNGNHTKIDTPVNFYENKADFLESITNWLSINCTIQSSDLLIGKNDGIDRVVGKEFYDALLVSKDKGYHLFSDDQVLRQLARGKEHNIKTFGIESLFIYLNSNNIIEPTFGLKSFLKLIKLNYNGLLIHSGLLYGLLIKEDVENLELVISYVKDKYNDIDFLVGSLINSVLQINNFKGKVGNIEYLFKNEAKKHYFDILHKIILKHYSNYEINKVFHRLINEVKSDTDKNILLKLQGDDD